MKLWFFLLYTFLGPCRPVAGSQTYLITAPRLLRLDAAESVVVQLFGFSEDVQVFVTLKTSMAPDHMVLSRDVVTLSHQNRHQAAAKIRLLPGQLARDAGHVILHVQSAAINQHVPLAVSHTNGFLFVQTDKPLYTPRQSVRVRAFSINQELRPANRSVSLTFKDPDHRAVAVAQVIDANTGILSLEEPFRIPANPKLGRWSVEAAYSGDFTTLARSDFEVKEYVVPRLVVRLEPDVHFISSSNFQNFRFCVTARYLHGAPVSNADVVLRFGYVGATGPPTIIPASVTRKRLSSSGDLVMNINIKDLLLTSLESLLEKHLYITVLVQEDIGGISQEAELAVKFHSSPYRLSLVSTSDFIKPGLSYNVQVVVKDHGNRPVSRVPVRLSRRQLFRASGASEDMMCHSGGQSQENGVAVFSCNTPADSLRAELEVETADPALPASGQAYLSLQVAAYRSPNRRYLLIDPPLSSTLQVGQQAHIHVFWSMPTQVPVQDLGYLVMSRGTVVHFGTQNFVPSTDQKLTVDFRVTAAMVPTVRLLVYVVAGAGQTPELVTDSVWLRVRDKCVSGLQTELSVQKTAYKPKEALQLGVQASQRGLMALNAIDMGLLSLQPDYKDPVSMVLQRIEESDLGCGGGGGRDAADVFRLAGLTFITNADAQPAAFGSGCKAAVRVRRSPTPEEIEAKVQTFRDELMQKCCRKGMEQVPRSTNCREQAKKVAPEQPLCQRVFSDCCRFYQGKRNQNLARDEDQYLNLDSPPSLVRSYFPESWLWEVQPISTGLQSITRTLPDSITSWEVRAIGVFSSGLCAADPVRVSTRLPLSVDVPLPYQVVRGEQVDLQGSVYNQQLEPVTFRVALSAGPAICLHKAEPVADGRGLHASTSDWRPLPAESVAKLSFTLLGLVPGEHTLTFTLMSRHGVQDVVVKQLRVVPEGVKQEEVRGGRLDPQGIYGSERRTLLLRNQAPPDTVPGTDVQRTLTIHGELLGDALPVLLDPVGLQQLVRLPSGSAEAELAKLLPLVQVYRYLESTGSWGLLGSDIAKNAADVRRRIREGLLSISSFRQGDSSFSMWTSREGSTWLTAAIVRAMAAADPVVPVDRQSLSQSLAWLIRARQKADGSFSERSAFRPNRVMAEGAEPLEREVYLTAFVLEALIHATRIADPILQLQFHDDSIRAAAAFISLHAGKARSVHVSAVAAYAMTLHDPNSIPSSRLVSGLERLARQRGSPPDVRYWQEPGPDQSSGPTVETTAYVLMTVLLKGRLQYATPVLNWLTQDQRLGDGFSSLQAAAVTLEAIAQYSQLVRHVDLDQVINVRYSRSGSLAQVQLTGAGPMAPPIQVTRDEDVVVTTGYGRGVSNIMLKTVFYQMAPPSHNCHFDLKTDVMPIAGMGTHLVVCLRYQPGDEEIRESGLTVMEIQLPTGVEPHLEDLKEYRDSGPVPLVSHFELLGSSLTIQMESVPATNFSCLAFRFRTGFTVRGAQEPLISVFELQDKGSVCSRHFSLQQKKLQRLCVDADCQCMAVACATFRRKDDPQVTLEQRRSQTCRPAVKYAYRVKLSSRRTEGDFETFGALVAEVLRTHADFEAVRPGTEVELIKKLTCSSVYLQNHKQYLIIGSSGSKLQNQVRYRLVLDSQAVLEEWPEDSGSILDDLALDLQLNSCS